MTAIAERVRGLAHSAHLTQSEVGRIVGASPRTVARWPPARSSPNRKLETVSCN